MNLKNIESLSDKDKSIDDDTSQLNPEQFLSDLSSDLKTIVSNIPVTDSSNSQTNSNSKNNTPPKKSQVLGRKKLIVLVNSIFAKIKSFSFIFGSDRLSIIQKRFNATLMLNRLGADPEKMSLTELNVVYDNFKGTLQSE